MTRPPLLYLVHRIPFPPNKGDKLRSFNLLRHLARHYSIHLGCFADDPADLVHVSALAQWCEEVCCVPIRPGVRRVASLRGLLTNEPLTLPYYRSHAMTAWVAQFVRRHRQGRALVFSSSMAQYLEPYPQQHCVVDFCDVDSAKWAEYAPQHRWPLSWLYGREARLLLEYEARIARQVSAVTFVSEAEADLFRKLAPGAATNVHAVGNGVDSDFFSPDLASVSPFPEGDTTLVFTGAMNYWPNIDAVLWFVREAWPALSVALPQLRLVVVGMNPAPEIRALESDSRIQVTGTVPDVRPYIRHASVVVAPLRVARGVQNKVLEAMACAKPLVVSDAAALGIDAVDGEHFVLARESAGFVAAVLALISDPARAHALGLAARARVLERFSWDALLSRIDPLLERPI